MHPAGSGKNWPQTGQDRTPSHRRKGREGKVEEGGGGGGVGGEEEGRSGCSAGQVPTGQTVSGRRRGGVTYGFTATLPDLLGVRAGSSLVYTQPWISAWNMSTSSQPISHRGGAAWAADTSRFPRTARPIPQKHGRASPPPTTPRLHDCRLLPRQSQTVRQRHSTAPLGHTTVPVPLGALVEARRGPLSTEMKLYRSQTATNLSRG